VEKSFLVNLKIFKSCLAKAHRNSSPKSAHITIIAMPRINLSKSWALGSIEHMCDSHHSQILFVSGRSAVRAKRPRKHKIICTL
jgi:hypothetical protein